MSKQLKRGEEVVVIAGAHKGKRGKVLNIIKDKNRIRVEGVAIVKRHMKKSQEHPEGAIIEKEGSIHYSNVMLAERYDNRKKG